MSLKEIGEKYKLTKERIRQIEKKAIKRLQHPSRKGYLEAYSA
jgi:RNA polymerase primary sigma factor